MHRRCTLNDERTRRKFGRKKEEAIAALLTQRRTSRRQPVSRALTPSTLKRWLRLPEFQKEYWQARRDAVSQANARLQQERRNAMPRCSENDGRPEHAGVRQGYGRRSIFDHAIKAIEIEDIEARVVGVGAGCSVIEGIAMNIRKRLEALEKGILREPATLTMPDGRTETMRRPRRLPASLVLGRD